MDFCLQRRILGYIERTKFGLFVIVIGIKMMVYTNDECGCKEVYIYGSNKAKRIFRLP